MNVTVVTPTIPGREEFLAEAVASVEAQTLDDVTHLIGLDKHYDGPGPTLNKLIREAKTEWVSILADDDLYDPDHLETLAANAADAADIVLSWSRFLGSDREQYRGEFSIDRLRTRQDTGMRGCFMFRKSLYEKLGGWPEGLMEDWQFLINAADAGARFAPVYRETWSYRQHDGSLSSAVTALMRGERPAQVFHLDRLATSNVTVLIPFLKGHGSKEWLQECVSGFPAGTKYLVAENDGDLAGALNEALESITTEWVVVFGHDDVPDDNMLDTLLAASGDADVVYPTMILTDEQLKPRSVFNADIFCPNRLQTWPFVSGGFLARTEMIRKAGGWRELETFEDWDLHIRMMRAGARYKACPDAKFLYRQHPKSRQKTQTREYSSVQDLRKHWQDLLVGERPEVKATFYYQATPATAYWRCVLPARHLPGTATSLSSIEVTQRETGEIDFVDHRGAAVTQFPAHNEAAAAAITMQAQGIRYLVEVDDNYLDQGDELWRGRAGWAKRIGEKSPHSVQGHRWITGQADGVIVTTPVLAKIYGEVNDNIYVCRNSVDPSDWPELVKPDDGVFRIGWFASRSHDRDADQVRKALSWASRQPGVEVVTIGLDPAGWDFRRFHFPWSMDYTGYRSALMALDVGVAPILSTSSALCRSDLKILEYSMAGALSIAQRLAPYEEWYDGPCLMASTPKEYVDRIRWCVKNQDEARALGAKARELVLNTRTIQHEIARWDAAISGEQKESKLAA